jgi:tRNA dimethylallyltransferase
MLDDWDVPRVPPDPALRERLNQRAGVEGLDTLVAELDGLDPERAAQIDRRNVRRVVRALEVALLRPHVTEPEPPREAIARRLVLGIELDRAELYTRIDQRVDAMFEAGLVAEVEALNARGWTCAMTAFSAIGYREVCGYLRGELTLEAVRERTKLATHRLARTQAAWFRRTDPRITWLPFGPDLVECALYATRAFFDGPAAQE